MNAMRRRGPTGFSTSSSNSSQKGGKGGKGTKGTKGTKGSKGVETWQMGDSGVVRHQQGCMSAALLDGPECLFAQE